MSSRRGEWRQLAGSVGSLSALITACSVIEFNGDMVADAQACSRRE